jgi:heterodisulfide reductase subunit C2
MSAVVSSLLGKELMALGDFDAEACMNCGVCSAICPLGIDLMPRRLFRYAVLGMRGRLRDEHEAIFSCLLCRSCEQNCPAGVHISDNVRLLRRWLLEEPWEVD